MAGNNKSSLKNLPTNPLALSTTAEPAFSQLKNRILRLRSATGFSSTSEEVLICPTELPESTGTSVVPSRSQSFLDSGYGSVSTDQAGCLDYHVGVSFSKGPVPADVETRYLDLRLLLRQPLLDAVLSKRAPTGDVSMKLKCANPNNFPCIVIQCDKRAVKKVKKFFDQSHIKELIGGDFLIYVVPGLRQLRAQEYEVHGLCNLLVPDAGTRIRIEGELGSCMATLGGVITVTKDHCQTLYGLTAGHALARLDRKPVSAPSSTESDYDSDEYTDSEDDGIGHSVAAQMAMHNSQDIEGLDPATSVKIGSVAAVSSQSADENSNYDWALIGLSERFVSTFWDCELRTLSSETRIPKVAKPLPSTLVPNVSVVTSRGVQKGSLAAAASSLLIAPGRDFVETYDFIPDEKSCLIPGDSGSWVICEETGEVFGHVVSIDMFGEAYVMPLDHTLAAIKEHLQADQIFVHAYQCQGAVSQLSKSNINSDQAPAPTTTSCQNDLSPDPSFEQLSEERAEQRGPTLQEVIAGLQTHCKLRDEEHPEFPNGVRRRRLSADLACHSDSGYSSLFEPSGPVAVAGQLENAALNKAQAVPQTQAQSHDEEAFAGPPKRGATFPGVQPNIIRRRPPRFYCNQCDRWKEGFRREADLHRHRDQMHQEVVKRWICVDPCGLKKPGIATNTDADLNFDFDFAFAITFNVDAEVQVPLNKCKACRSGKQYGAYYNAAAHLRRTHFKGKEWLGDGERPSVHDLRPWMKAIYVSKDGVVRHDLDAADVTAASCMPPPVIGHPIAPQRASIREDQSTPNTSQDTVYSWSDESMESITDLGDDIMPNNADVSALKSYCRSFPQRNRPRNQGQTNIEV